MSLQALKQLKNNRMAEEHLCACVCVSMLSINLCAHICVHLCLRLVTPCNLTKCTVVIY